MTFFVHSCSGRAFRGGGIYHSVRILQIVERLFGFCEQHFIYLNTFEKFYFC